MTAPDVDEFFYREVGPVWGELRGGLWHSTGSHRFRQILASGEIQPSPDLPPHEFRWAALGTTYTRSIGAVSLFDFAEADWEWLLDESIPKVMPANCWGQFLRAPTDQMAADQWTATVWLRVERSLLPGFIHWRDIQADWQAGGPARKWMPRIEACHKGPLPLSACSEVVVVCAVEPKQFRRMSLHPFLLDQLDTLEAEWRACYAGRYEFRALPEKERLKSWLSRAPAVLPGGEADPAREEALRAAKQRLERYRKRQGDSEHDL